MDTMETFSPDTPPSCFIFPALRPALTRPPPSRSWHSASDLYDSPFIAPCSDADCPHINFARNHALQGGPTKLLYTDPTTVYPSPPSSSSTSKTTIPLPEEVGEFAPLYSTHLLGILDSPPVMRRKDLASQKPLTPPPTMPQSTLNLPDADVDMPFDDQGVEEDEEECEDDDSYSTTSRSAPESFQSVLPLSPLSPSWDPPCARALSMASSHDFSASERMHTLFSPCDVSAPPALEYCHTSPLSSHEPSSLLDVDVDVPRPLLAPISIPWASSQLPDSEHDPLSSSSSLTSLTDYDHLPTPNSPLISRLDLPDLEDDGLPQIVPSSPCRRSCSCLPDSGSDMGDLTSGPALTLPGQPLLSLPGAETDDDLIPKIPPPSLFVPFTPSQPLLFIDDPRDVPLPRSPSPEDFDFCLSPEEITDPELGKMFDLRKRSIAAERAARRLEALTDDVDLFTRAEARKIRKRERERSKEVGALLRLKLGQGISICPQEQSPECDQQNHQRRRGVMGSISQLVAQMVFRRNETSRPLAKRKSANVSREYARSSLAHAVERDE